MVRPRESLHYQFWRQAMLCSYLEVEVQAWYFYKHWSENHIYFLVWFTVVWTEKCQAAIQPFSLIKVFSCRQEEWNWKIRQYISLHHSPSNTFSVFNTSCCNHNRHLQNRPSSQTWEVNINPNHGDNSYLDWFL